MLYDAEQVAETRSWFLKGQQDLGVATHDLTADPPFLADAAFHSQQAVEKSLKGFLTWHSVLFRKTHSLEEIGELCLRIDPTLKVLIDEAVPLTKYAWEFRYPGPFEEPSREEVNAALATAREVHNNILDRLPREVRP